MWTHIVKTLFHKIGHNIAGNLKSPPGVQERMANMLNDCQISPTNYMIAFLRQRGWQMPEITMRIPNVIPEVDPIAARVRPSPFASLIGLPAVLLLVMQQGSSLASP